MHLWVTLQSYLTSQFCLIGSQGDPRKSLLSINNDVLEWAHHRSGKWIVFVSSQLHIQWGQVGRWKSDMMVFFTCISCFSRIRLFVTPWTVARQAPLSMGFSRQEYWSRFPSPGDPSPGDLPDPGIKPMSLMSPALSGRFFTTSTPWEARCYLPPH